MIAKNAKFLHAYNTDSDQTARSLFWAHMSEGTFSNVMAKFNIK